MKAKTCVSCLLGVVLSGMIGLSIGCGPEMPAPPKKAFGSSAEEDFNWAMERMRHAMEMFRPASRGLSVKREMDYELTPPSDQQAKYTARVTISTRTSYLADSSSTDALRRRAEAKKEASEIKLDNPFTIPGDDSGGDGLTVPNVPIAEIDTPAVADPGVPTQRLEDKRDYLLEYVGDQWRLITKDIEEIEQMWFDYALEQGEFAPGAAAKN